MPDLTLPLKKRPLGGLGIYFIRHFSDEVRYRVTEKGENELTLVKKAF
jgi:anti-sigma regulatory factor (Ser/Thr protein kinase)